MSIANGRIEVRLGPPTPTGRWLIGCPHCGESEPGTVGVNSVNGYGTQYGAMTRATRHARWHGPSVARYGGDFPLSRSRRRARGMADLRRDLLATLTDVPADDGRP